MRTNPRSGHRRRSGVLWLWPSLALVAMAGLSGCGTVKSSGTARTGTEQLLAERDGHILILTLNRPERLNAVVPALVDDLLDALATAADSGTRAVVLAGRGRAFCAGHDLKEPMAENDSRARLARPRGVTHEGRPEPPRRPS